MTPATDHGARTFYARRGAIKIGPFATREAAISAFREAHPFKGPDYMASARKNDFMTGWGNGDVYFHIDWHPIRA